MWEQFGVQPRGKSASFWRALNIWGGEFHGQFGSRKCLWSGCLCKQLVIVLSHRRSAQTHTHVPDTRSHPHRHMWVFVSHLFFHSEMSCALSPLHVHVWDHEAVRVTSDRCVISHPLCRWTASFVQLEMLSWTNKFNTHTAEHWAHCRLGHWVYLLSAALLNEIELSFWNQLA